ncbi:mevalonate kinase-like isoform X2 [Artemia franciscana]|uniref:Mevalonate kinase n=1 Tax=Artemia franciscana TaxID=6661 RepID=A0AA88IHV2_ARTSF|nr:hypothetical protein QYM36_000952 [Artemia franciscana]
MEINVSAPGKVILFGEHSVVYGKLALAASVDLRTTLTIFPSDGNYFKLKFESLDVEKKWEVEKLKEIWKDTNHHFIDVKTPTVISDENLKLILNLIGPDDGASAKSLTVAAFIYLYNILVGEPLPYTFVVKSEAPVGAGLGSSASYSVVAAAGLWILGELLHGSTIKSSSELTEKNLEYISQWAYVCEKLFHGSPSGIDNSVCTFGGVLSYQDGQFQHVVIPKDKLRIILVNSKVSRRTSDQVIKGKNRRDLLPTVMEHVYNALHATAEEAKLILGRLGEKYDYKRLSELVEVSHYLLSAVGAGHPALDEIVKIAAKHKMKSKLTGLTSKCFGGTCT